MTSTIDDKGCELDGCEMHPLAEDQSDAKLVAACLQGRTSGWNHLIERHARFVLSVALSYGLNRADADDAVQRTFELLIRHLAKLRNPEALRGWLGVTCRREAWRIATHSRKEPSVDPATLEDRVSLITQDREGARWELAAEVDFGLSRIDERCRHLLELLYLDRSEPDYKRVADQLGMRVGSIGPTRARCLAKLRELLQ